MVEEFESAGMKFVGRDVQNERMEIMELSGHPFYVAVQYHPEYISRPMRPSAPYLGLILAATDKLQSFLSMVCKENQQCRHLQWLFHGLKTIVLNQSLKLFRVTYLIGLCRKKSKHRALKG